MSIPNLTKGVNVKEIEHKFIISDFNKNDIWDREFIIFQWYMFNSQNKESKLKLIIDLHSFERKYVRVTKERLSNSESDKIVDYLDYNSINFSNFIGKPFVCKRRSIKKDIHLDKFIFSKDVCKFLLEDEGDKNGLELFCKKNKIEIINDVTNNPKFRNINMTIDFKELHLSSLKLILQLF